MNKLLLLLISLSLRADPVVNVVSCDGFNYVLWLDDVLNVSGSSAKHYSITSGSFTESEQGATFTAEVQNTSNSQLKFSVVINFGNFQKQNGVVHTTTCDYTANPSLWHYFTYFSGTLIGKGDLAGGRLNISQYNGMSLQVGIGGSLRNASLKGAATWFNATVVSQPTNKTYKFSAGTGDINFTTTGSNWLPLEKDGFAAEKIGQKIVLRWNTPTFSIDQISGYKLDVSYNGLDFDVIDYLPTSVLEYIHTPDHTNAAIYYRLSTLTQQRLVITTKLLKIFAEEQSLTYPNPANGSTNIVYKGKWVVYTLKGYKVLEGEGDTKIELPSGVYYVDLDKIYKIIIL